MELITEKPLKHTISEDYKQTEVGMIPEDWEIQMLGQSSTLSARIGWQGLTTDEYLDNGKYYLVTGTDFEKGRIQWDECFYVDYERFKQDKKIQLQKNDLLVTKDGTIGKVAHVNDVPKPATLNSGIFVIRPREEKFDPSFFYYILSSKYFKKFLEQLSAGSTINHLYQRDIVKFKYPLPPTLKEQRVIAGALSDVDDLIAELDALIEKKLQVKKGAMQQLLTPNGSEQTGKKRLSGFDGEWEEKTLSELCSSISDGTHYTPNYVDHGVPFYSVENVTADNYSDVKYISEKEHKKLIRRCKPEKGDILLTRIGTLGKTKLIDWDIEASIYVSLALLKLSDWVDEQYFYRYTESDQFVEEVKKKALTNASPQKINMGELLNVPVVLPKDENEQKVIAQILSDMDSEIQALESKRDKYKQIKQGMMQELLTGKTRLV
jgi:type I restriction enzyme S subunit